MTAIQMEKQSTFEDAFLAIQLWTLLTTHNGINKSDVFIVIPDVQLQCARTCCLSCWLTLTVSAFGKGRARSLSAAHDCAHMSPKT